MNWKEEIKAFTDDWMKSGKPFSEAVAPLVEKIEATTNDAAMLDALVEIKAMATSTRIYSNSEFRHRAFQTASEAIQKSRP